MRMVMICYNEAIDEEVMQALTACCIECYTKWTRVLGWGKLSEPHMDTSTWPGANNVCMAVVEDKQAAAIVSQVKKLRETIGKEGVKAFILPVEEVT